MSPRPPRKNVQPLRILLIDDDEGEYLLVRDLLARFPGRAIALDWVTASSEALRVFRESGSHDLYLIDYRLLEHTGIDALRDLRASGCRAPLVLLTTVSDESVDRQAMRAGAADYLIKSEMTRPLLQRAIRHAIERSELARSLRESEERYRALARDFPGMLVVLDHHGTVLVAEGAAARAHLEAGAEPAAAAAAAPEPAGRPVREVFPDGFGERLLRVAARALAEGAAADVCDRIGCRWLLSAAPQRRFDAPPQALVLVTDASVLASAPSEPGPATTPPSAT